MENHILEKLNMFLDSYKNINDVVGVLVCGSYVTGHPNKHSDLDVHLILKDGVFYRERGNVIVEGLLIEYFANTKQQILSYFNKDYRSVSLMSQTQFATGMIIRDDLGIVANLKKQALIEINKNFEDLNTVPNGLALYSIWDSLDDLEALLEEDRQDFDFVYYNKLDKLLALYLKVNKIPYNCKSIVGHLTSEIVREKYLLKEITNKKLVELIKASILGNDKKTRFAAYSKLANNLLTRFNFSIDKFVFKSEEDI